jgi:hypothetical protein
MIWGGGILPSVFLADPSRGSLASMLRKPSMPRELTKEELLARVRWHAEQVFKGPAAG